MTDRTSQGGTDESQADSLSGGRRQLARKVTIERILSAAARVFARSGYEGATMTDIAKEARLPKANVNYHFRDKRVLYRRVLQEVQSLWSDPLELFSAETDPAVALDRYIRAKIDLARRFPVESRVFANEMIHGAPFIGTYLRGAYNRRLDRVWKTFDAWTAAGLINPIDPKHLMLVLWAATQSYADHAVSVAALFGQTEIPESEFEAAKAQLSAIIIGGIGARNGRRLNTTK
jgi:TetR/AcrR family transcriptional regulator